MTLRPALVLASSSRYRRELLERLRIPFTVDRPDVDETTTSGEEPGATARRLSLVKAQAVAARHPEAVVIGSDQVAECEGRAIGKPGHHEAAVAQLRAMRGKAVRFHSGLCVVAPGHPPQVDAVVTTVRFRNLDDAEIERYLRLDEPYDCAGSAKSESLGIALLETLESDDPTALVGLPLIRLVTMLRTIDYPVLG